jgi:hypothetical protein
MEAAARDILAIRTKKLGWPAPWRSRLRRIANSVNFRDQVPVDAVTGGTAAERRAKLL